MTDEEFDRETNQTLQRANAMIETADEDAEKIFASLNRFIEKANGINDDEDHVAATMAFNFMLSDEVLHRHMNVFSIFSLIEMLSRHDATAKALIRHAPNQRARRFVVSEWLQHSEAYGGNKSAFARDYVARVWNELHVRITEKQMREVWLADTPRASIPDGLPAAG